MICLQYTLFWLTMQPSAQIFKKRVENKYNIGYTYTKKYQKGDYHV